MLLKTIRASRHRFRIAAILILLLVFACELVHIARVYSANWDEAHHLYDGYNILTRHDYRVNAEVPPLVKLLAALPLLPMHLQVPPSRADAQGKYAFLDGRTFVFSNGGDRVLFPARMVCMVWSLLLAFLVYVVGRSMFGAATGLAALALFIFDPLLLAHGTLVSTDIGSALFLFAAVYAFYCYVQSEKLAPLLTTGLLAGLALAAKFTGILIAPMLLLLCIAEAVRLRSWAVLGKRLAACAGVFLLAWAVVWSFYGFRYAARPAPFALSPALAPYIASMPNHSGAGALAFAARHRLLPEAYLWGLANTKHTEWEYTSYFFGRVYRHGPWQYFPAAFLIKSTLPLLVLLALAPVLRKWKSQKLVFLLTPVCVYFAVVTTSHFDIGARHLLPIYPFLYVLAGAGAAAAFRKSRVWAAAAALLLLWQAATSIRVAPAYMAYGNEAWGGPLAVRKYLSDANVDWGQQLKTVKQYLDANRITDCWFAYFPDGAVEPRDYGIPCRRLPTPSGLWWLGLPMEVPPVIDGTVLISESDLDGVESGDGPLNPYEAFRHMEPVAILQDGVYVYRGRFAIPLASAWVDMQHSTDLLQAGHVGAALATAERAVLLAPNSARTQLNVAEMLSAQGRRPEALPHYEAASHWLQANRPELEQEELGPRIRAGLEASQNQR